MGDGTAAQTVNRVTDALRAAIGGAGAALSDDATVAVIQRK